MITETLPEGKEVEWEKLGGKRSIEVGSATEAEVEWRRDAVMHQFELSFRI